MNISLIPLPNNFLAPIGSITIPIGGSLSFNVEFKPINPGTFNFQFPITNNSTNLSNSNGITVYGIGSNNIKMNIPPPVINFGNTNVGQNQIQTLYFY